MACRLCGAKSLWFIVNWSHFGEILNQNPKFLLVKINLQTPALIYWEKLRFYLFLDPRSWWRCQTETFSALLAHCAGNSPLSPMNSLHKGHWGGVLMLSLIRTGTNGWENSSDEGDLRRNRAHYEVTVIVLSWWAEHWLWCWPCRTNRWVSAWKT